MNINNTDFMKKILLSMLSLLVSMTMFAQSEAVRKMNLVYDGQVVYSRSVSLIDSIKFVWEETGDDVIGGGEVDSTKQLYVGVVAFNQSVRQMPITSDVEAVKAFINEQTNDKDFTSFAYSVSKGNQMFDAEALPAFDKIFMLNFSDGTDNYSNMKWGEEGRMVSQRNVYDTARYDLQQRDGLNSYALGFGNDVGFGANMKKVVMGSGSYFNVTSANELQSTFNEIAKSMLASAKNVLLKTNPGYYVGGDCKYFRFTFTAEGGYTDTIYAQMEGYPAIGYTLTISKVSNNYAYFDAPAKGVMDDETGKVHIPLNNLKFTKDGEELQYKFDIEVSFDGELYYEDVEEASTAEEINKRIAVVLVLDCSTSMGDAFAPMKAAAVNFIETMEKMEVDDSEPNIPDVPYAKVRFQKTAAYSRIVEMCLIDETKENVLAAQSFGSESGTSSYFEIPSGYAYPLVYYIEDLDTEEGRYYYMLDEPYYYYFEAGYKYTVVATDDGTNFVFYVTQDGVANAPAKVVATRRVPKNELHTLKKAKL